MSTSAATDQAERIIGALRAHEVELRRAGISSLSLFGSFARGDAEAAGDIDLAVEFDTAACMDLFRLTAPERRMRSGARQAARINDDELTPCLPSDEGLLARQAS
jgi:predicted nucleotidyltransferase